MYEKLKDPSPGPRLMLPPQLLPFILSSLLRSSLHQLSSLALMSSSHLWRPVLSLQPVNRFGFNLCIKVIKKRIKCLLVLFLILATLIPLCNFLGKFLGRVACTTSETLNFPLHRTVFSPICCLLHWIIVATPSFYKLSPHFHPQWLPECDFLFALQYFCDRSLQQPLLILLHLPTVSVLVFLVQNSLFLFILHICSP